MIQNIFLQKYHKSIQYLYKLKNILKYFFIRTTQIYLCKSKEVSEESIQNTTTSDNTFALILLETRLLSIARFNGNCLIRNNVYNFRINLYISYIVDTWSRDLNTNLTRNNCLFGSTGLTKNADPDKY